MQKLCQKSPKKPNKSEHNPKFNRRKELIWSNLKKRKNWNYKSYKKYNHPIWQKAHCKLSIILSSTKIYNTSQNNHQSQENTHILILIDKDLPDNRNFLEKGNLCLSLQTTKFSSRQSKKTKKQVETTCLFYLEILHRALFCFT